VAVEGALTLRAAIPVTVLQDSSVMEPNVLVSRVNMRNVHVCPRHDSMHFLRVYTCTCKAAFTEDAENCYVMSD